VSIERDTAKPIEVRRRPGAGVEPTGITIFGTF
jgi:hypothetical protein